MTGGFCEAREDDNEGCDQISAGDDGWCDVMIEVEIKMPVDDRQKMEVDLERLGFVRSRTVREEDCYFDSDFGQIRERGEALRVRTVTDTSAGRAQAAITYKGRKMDRVSMSRRELETWVEDGEVCARILEALGFHPVPPEVIKIRQEYTLGRMTACLDNVLGLGDFL